MFRPLAAAAVAALTVAACATPTVYAPVSPTSHGVGFSEYKIENNRYRVTFQGGEGAPEQQVNDYVFLRAAEITLRDGYDWFQVIDRYGERSGSPYSSGPRVSIGVGGGNYGYHSGVGVGVGTSFPIGGATNSGAAFSRTIEIVEGRNPRPANPDVYDARQVAASLAPNAPRPVAPGY
jgi:hypothetical protein